MKGLMFLFVPSVLVACGWLEPPAAEAARSAGGPNAMRLAGVVQASDSSLALGDSLYHHWCNSCHALYPPETKHADAWFDTVRKMQSVASGAGTDTLTRTQMFAVVDYLEAHADTTGNP